MYLNTNPETYNIQRLEETQTDTKTTEGQDILYNVTDLIIATNLAGKLDGLVLGLDVFAQVALLRGRIVAPVARIPDELVDALLVRFEVGDGG